jgi:methyl-accepting chemotaxis protein
MPQWKGSMGMNLQVSTRLILGFAVLVALAAISGGLAIYNLNTLSNLTKNLYEHPMAVSNAILSADGNIVRMHRGMKDVALARSPAEIDQAEAEIGRYEQAVMSDLAVVKERFRGPQEMLDAVGRAFDNWRPIRQTIVALKRENHDELSAQVTNTIGTQGTQEVSKAMQVLKDSANAEGRSFFESAEATRDRTIAVFVGLVLLSVALGVGTGYWVTTSITRPLARAVNLAETVAAGNLAGVIEVAGNDEIATLLRALDAMRAKLRQVAKNLHEGAQNLSSAADKLSSNAQQVARSSDEQSAAAAAMSAAIEQMSVSIGHVSDNARDADQATRQTSELSTAGAKVIESAVSEIGKATEAVNNSSNLIQSLERQSREISSIANVIKEIADQTNLLALNAAIEAARAGEQGRGFAVVADEVRKLAERTSQSTHEITNMISGIQDGTRTAVAGMEAGVALVTSGAALASEAGVSIVSIRNGAVRVVTAVNEISSSLHEQRSASEDIAKHVEQIAQMVDQNNAAVRETAAAAAALQTLASTLKHEAAWFRV